MPTLPSTTAAFRFNPRCFARFIGDLLNARENSSCDIASSAKAEVEEERGADLHDTRLLGAQKPARDYRKGSVP